MAQPNENTEEKYTVFICYRRDDAAMAAGRIDDFLAIYFNRARIFRDVREIGIGSKFPERLQQALAQSKVLIAVIGEKWLTISDKSGRRRIDNPSDWVRTEIVTAINNGTTIIPVLIENAEMPKKEDLPDDLQQMTNWQALRIRAETFTHDMLILREYLEKVEGLESSSEHPHFEELRERAIEEYREALFSDAYREDIDWIKDVLREEMYEEFFEDFQNDFH